MYTRLIKLSLRPLGRCSLNAPATPLTWETPCCRAQLAGSWSYWTTGPGTQGCVAWQYRGGYATESCHWGAKRWGEWATTGPSLDSALYLRHTMENNKDLHSRPKTPFNWSIFIEMYYCLYSKLIIHLEAKCNLKSKFRNSMLVFAACQFIYCWQHMFHNPLTQAETESFLVIGWNKLTYFKILVMFMQACLHKFVLLTIFEYVYICK